MMGIGYVVKIKISGFVERLQSYPIANNIYRSTQNCKHFLNE
jgi:hypothetical protein